MQPQALHLAILLVLLGSAETALAAETTAYSLEGIIDSYLLAQVNSELPTSQEAATIGSEVKGAEPQPPIRSDTRTIDEIYRHVFGRDRPAMAQDDYPILIDGINVGVFRVRPDTDRKSVV